MHALIRAQSSDGIVSLDNGAGTIVDVDERRYREIGDGLVSVTPLVHASLNGFSLDTTQLHSFLVNQLAFTEATIYKKDFLLRAWRQALPVRGDGGMWANEVRYQKSERKGIGRRISANAGDIPTADIEYGDRSVPIFDGAIGYQYSIKELAQTVVLGRSLPADRADAAMEGFEDHINQVALVGESPLPSFFAFTGVPVITVSGSGWNSLTGYQIAAQMMTQVVTYNKATGQNGWPTHIAMDVDRLDHLNQPLGSYNDTTILDYFLRNNAAKKQANIDIQIVSIPQAAGAGAGSKDRMIFYRKDDQYVRFQLPVPLMFLAPQLEGLGVKVPGFYRYGGVEFTKPNWAQYVDFPGYAA